MNITIATEAEERVCETEHETEGGEEYVINWRYTVKPIRGTPLNQLMTKHGVTWSMLDTGGDSGPVQMFFRGLASESLGTILAVQRDGTDPVTINGKPATDPTLRDIILEAFMFFGVWVGRQALELGRRLQEEQGNLPCAPATPPSTPTESAASGAAI